MTMMSPAHADIAAWVQRHGRLMLFSHRRPDGDALGSLLAFALLSKRLSVSSEIFLFEPLPPRFAFLGESTAWNVWSEASATALSAADGIVILDTCSFSQLDPIAKLLPAAPPTLVIDHHATSDAIGVRPSDLRWIDPQAGAACLLLTEWAIQSGIEIDQPLAEALFAGIATDSGWFRFSNADERMLRAAAVLVAAGARPNELFMAIQQQEPAAKLRLSGQALARMELHDDDRIAVMQLRTADFKSVGADHTMTDEMVNEPLRISSVLASFLFVEQEDGVIRANLRSKHTLDVARLAQTFGGGGHARAAGARLNPPWTDAVKSVVGAAQLALRS